MEEAKPRKMVNRSKANRQIEKFGVSLRYRADTEEK